jgi:hypothetical protein
MAGLPGCAGSIAWQRYSNVQDHAVIALRTNHLAQTAAVVCLSGRSATPERFGAGPDIGCGYLMPGPHRGGAVDRRVREHLAGAGSAVKPDVHGALVAAPPTMVTLNCSPVALAADATTPSAEADKCEERYGCRPWPRVRSVPRLGQMLGQAPTCGRDSGGGSSPSPGTGGCWGGGLGEDHRHPGSAFKEPGLQDARCAGSEPGQGRSPGTAVSPPRRPGLRSA